MESAMHQMKKQRMVSAPQRCISPFPEHPDQDEKEAEEKLLDAVLLRFCVSRSTDGGGRDDSISFWREVVVIGYSAKHYTISAAFRPS